MAKIRINKLALELNVQNDQIIDELKNQDCPVKNHMSSIDEDMANYIRDFFTEKPVDGAGKKKNSTSKTKATSKATVKSATKKKAATKTSAKAATKTIEKKEEDAKKPAKAKTSKKTEAKETAKPKAATKPAAKKEEAPGKEATQKKAPAEKSSPSKPKKKDAAGGRAAKPVDQEELDEDGNKTGRKLGLKIVKKEGQDKESTPKPPRAKGKPQPSQKKVERGGDRNIPRRPVATQPAPAPTAVVEEEGFEVVRLMDTTALRDLSDKLKCTPNDLIKDLMGMGVMATINQSLDFDIAFKLADQRGFEVERVTPESEVGFEDEDEPDNEKDRVPRPPIVTIMGHVDHGKTSLLDAIRKTNVTESEKGGITQHIGAYQAKVNGKPITFLDTPGHEAFTAMRARGAQITDIVVLVVAADDGLKPQTKEAIHHATAAGTPLVVAINKIDKPDAKPDEVKKQLADQGLIPEEWGGQTIIAEVSAKMGTGLENLLEMLLLQAEIMELKANPKVRARGTVIESHLDKGRGPVATIIVEKGSLKVGDPFIVGNYFGKVRALNNDLGKTINEATLAMPVEVVGIPEVPDAGDKFMVVKDEKRARQLSQLKLQRQRETVLSAKPRISMEDLHQQILEGKIQELNLIIKADVQGSIQAVQEAVTRVGTDKVRIKVIHDAVGGITESDVLLASASNAIVIGFNVRPTEQAAAMAQQENVDVRMYGIIYDAIEDIKKAMEGLLEPTFREKVTGRAEIREVFTIPKVGVVAGCHVLSGTLERNRRARLLRDNVVVYEGKIQTLRRFKEDVKEVASGYECGLSLEKFQDVKQGDIIEPFVLEEVAP
ncbi:Translation initiation factor IF-2 [Nitrospina gracilis 3/211]|uniref:Translation initiation factor IF-2 n=1 Tax=Nitrospina gracilis (strain 3/211) TaxID=1266370 RepID=M1ZEQ8_NITG3|nr:MULTISPECIES: translation initiation factor IF-2 [Nitrospina]CCQ92072.1 Translation initiation factor IF-2 [Nitrospina gracilis 3/211]